MTIKHILSEETAATNKQFLRRMAEMYLNQSPMTNDCRSTVVRKLQKQIGRTGYIYIMGFEGSKDAVHVLLTDGSHNVLADAYKGKFSSDRKRYLVDLPSGPGQVLDVTEVEPLWHWYEKYVLPTQKK